MILLDTQKVALAIFIRNFESWIKFMGNRIFGMSSYFSSVITNRFYGKIVE